MDAKQIREAVEDWEATNHVGLNVRIIESSFGTQAGALLNLWKHLAEKIAEDRGVARGRWTTVPPQTQGWYWSRVIGGPAQIVTVTERSSGLVVWLRDEDYELAEFIRLSPGCEWSGPIPNPSS